jgi:hypothetical protein
MREDIRGATFRFLLLPPEYSERITCPDCRKNFFHASSGLGGRVGVVCRFCDKKWWVVFMSSDEEYIEAVKATGRLFTGT